MAMPGINWNSRNKWNHPPKIQFEPLIIRKSAESECRWSNWRLGICIADFLRVSPINAINPECFNKIFRRNRISGDILFAALMTSVWIQNPGSRCDDDGRLEEEGNRKERVRTVVPYRFRSVGRQMRNIT